MTVTLIPAIIILFITGGCKKESTLTPSGLDENHFINQNNPNDPVDQAIFNFYRSTGVASFYNDTLALQKISNEGEIPDRFQIVKLSLNYFPTGTVGSFTRVEISSRHHIPNVIELLQKDVLPRIPDSKKIPCILYVDSLVVTYKLIPTTRIENSHGFTAAYGFNTVAVVVKDVQAMDESDHKMYAASILAGLAVKQLQLFEQEKLQQNFYNISRSLAKGLLGVYDVYSGTFLNNIGVVPTPNSIALLYYPILKLGSAENVSLPEEDSDLRSFLTLVFRYSEEELYDMYKDYPGIIQKISVIRQLLSKYKYKIDV